MKYLKTLLISVFVLLMALPALAQEATPEVTPNVDDGVDFAEALAIAQEWSGDAYAIVEIDMDDDDDDDDDDDFYWEVTVYALESGMFSEIYIDMTTGEVLQEILNDDDDQDDDRDDDDDDFSYDDIEDPTVIQGILIDMDTAIAEAQRVYPNRTVIGLELEDDEGVLTWVVIFAASGEEGTREVEISTQTGNILGFGFDADYDDDRWDDDNDNDDRDDRDDSRDDDDDDNDNRDDRRDDDDDNDDRDDRRDDDDDNDDRDDSRDDDDDDDDDNGSDDNDDDDDDDD